MTLFAVQNTSIENEAVSHVIPKVNKKNTNTLPVIYVSLPLQHSFSYSVARIHDQSHILLQTMKETKPTNRTNVQK